MRYVILLRTQVWEPGRFWEGWRSFLLSNRAALLTFLYLHPDIGPQRDVERIKERENRYRDKRDSVFPTVKRRNVISARASLSYLENCSFGEALGQYVIHLALMPLKHREKKN